MNQTTKRLIKKYNQENNYIVISEFPSREKSNKDTGLSRYSHNTIISLKNTVSSDSKAIVFANIVTKEEVYEENNTLVIRCFKKDHLSSFAKFIFYAAVLGKVKSVLFEFEFATYGNIKINAAIPAVLLAFKLLGKKTFFALHPVVADLRVINTFLNLSKKSPFLFILGRGLQFFYFAVGIFADKIIVLEGELKSRLSLFVNPQKIITIPHGIELIEPDAKINKKPIGFSKNNFVILAFGYIAWYKGFSELIQTFNKLPRKINGKTLKLVIAGGKGATQKGKPHYERYYNRIVSLAKTNPRIILTGFVAQEDIKKYFNLADLCVYPYKVFISSSGPLSFGITYQKPLVLSNNLSDYLQSEDFNQALIESNLSKKDLFIKINPAELKRIITKVMSDQTYKKQMQIFTSSLLKSRSWENLGKKYSSVLFAGQKAYRRSIISLIKLRLDFL